MSLAESVARPINILDEVTCPVGPMDSDARETQTGATRTEGQFTFPHRTAKMPPICIRECKYNWKSFTELLEKEQLTDFTAKKKGEGNYEIHTKNSDTFRSMTALFDKKEFSYHSFLLPEEKNLKVVIRNLPIDAKPTDIQEKLREKDFTALKVEQLMKGRGKDRAKMPLFLVTLSKTPKNNEIYHLKYLMYLHIKVERYRGRRGPTQCFRCQRYHHAQAACHHPPCAAVSVQALMKAGIARNLKILSRNVVTVSGKHTSSNWRVCEAFPKQKPNAPKFLMKGSLSINPTPRLFNLIFSRGKFRKL
ncbi:uncharacterized protein LOC118181146 [Stegodyphus dumicola]|uniref:uncharacterized protein LOC118181146 n=1 Tax=Stegodyphus dumicola TaxID=202533 RepID=UPI0015B0175C|nr:uncharacterized protein LOC118181146 [Stegodyphus dumicola]